MEVNKIYNMECVEGMRMLKEILKALAIIFVPTLLLAITSIALYYIVGQLQGSVIGDMTSCLIIILFVVLYSKALGQVGNLIDRL